MNATEFSKWVIEMTDAEISSSIDDVGIALKEMTAHCKTIDEFKAAYSCTPPETFVKALARLHPFIFKKAHGNEP